MFSKRPGRPTDLGYDANTERTTKPRQIARNLQRFKDGRCLLSITIPGQAGRYNSAILDVDAEHETLVLDELNALDGHEALLAHKKFHVACRLNGIEYRFASILRSVEQEGGLATYHAVMPTLMQHIQRRDDYRVPVARGSGIEVQIADSSDPNSKGELADLSLGGLGARLQSQSAPRKGEVLPVCSILLPDADPIRAEVEVRFSSTDQRHNIVRLGGKFVNLEHQQQHQLARLIKQLEREYLRKK